MSALAIRRLLRRRRHQLALVAAIVMLGGVIAVHHSPVAMGDMHDGIGAGAVAQMCLGVFAAVGAAVIAVALGVLAISRPRSVLAPAPLLPAFAPAPAPRGRDGPALLRLLCVCRC